jgi:hypothetical protein
MSKTSGAMPLFLTLKLGPRGPPVRGQVQHQRMATRLDKQLGLLLGAA